MKLSIDLLLKANRLAEDVYRAKDAVKIGKKGRDLVRMEDFGDFRAIVIAGSNDRYDWWDNLVAWAVWVFGRTVKGHKRWWKRSVVAHDWMLAEAWFATDKPIVFIGHSLGGAVAQNIWLQREDRRKHFVVTVNSPKPWRKFATDVWVQLARFQICHVTNTAEPVHKMPFRNECFGFELVKHIDLKGLDHSNFDATEDVILAYSKVFAE